MSSDDETAGHRVEYDPTTETYRSHYDGDLFPPSTAVVLALATITGRGVEELTPLQEAVDPDALDEIFRSPRRRSADDTTLTFTYADHEVSVRGSGDVTIRSGDDS